MCSCQLEQCGESYSHFTLTDEKMDAGPTRSSHIIFYTSAHEHVLGHMKLQCLYPLHVVRIHSVVFITHEQQKLQDQLRM